MHSQLLYKCHYLLKFVLLDLSVAIFIEQVVMFSCESHEDLFSTGFAVFEVEFFYFLHNLLHELLVCHLIYHILQL